jgi:hypothetical protein
MSPNITRVEGQTFVGANVQIDGGVGYVKCKFVKCNLVVTGVAPVQVAECAFEECRWSFTGPAANVFSFLKAMHQTEGKEMVEAIIREIRGLPAERQPLNPGLKSGGKIQ